MKTASLLSPKSRIMLFLMGIIFMVSLDVILFSNCVVPGDDQPPHVLKKGEQQFGISGHTILLAFPAEIGAYYRMGLENGKDIGFKIHNFGSLVGVLGDVRKKVGGNHEMLKAALGVYTDQDHYAIYFAPSFLFGGEIGYWGIKLNNYAFFNGYNYLVFDSSEEDYNSTSYAIGPTLVAGFQTRGDFKFYGGLQAGAIFPLNSSQIWPILQLETGLGYAF